VDEVRTVVGHGPPAGAPRGGDAVAHYSFPVEIEVRSVGAEIDREEIIDAAFARLVEELSAI
jgi:hypothetical protein